MMKARYPQPIDPNDPLNIGYIYIIGVQSRDGTLHSRFKIGRTINIWQRFEELETLYPFRIYIRHCVRIEHHFDVETGLHRLLRSCQVKDKSMGREWFDIPPGQLSGVIGYLNSCRMPDDEYATYLRNKQSGFPLLVRENINNIISEVKSYGDDDE